jgi:hypothetical protein
LKGKTMPYEVLVMPAIETGQIEARIGNREERLDEYGPLLLVDWVLAHESKPNQKYHASDRAPPEAWGF